MNSALKSELAPHVDTIKTRLESSQGAQAGGVAVATQDEQSKHIAQIAAQELKTWYESADGKATLEALKGHSLEQIRIALGKVLQGPYFASTMSLARTQARTSSDISFPINTVSLGFVAEVDFLGGLYGSIGYAADPTNIDGSSVIYIAGAILEGIEAGGDVGVQIGVWKNSVSDLDGYYNAQQLAVVDEAGIMVWSYEQSQSVVGLAVDIAGGADDGLSEAEVYIETFGFSHQPVYQDENASHFLILTSLQCQNTNEAGHDEVYFTFRPDSGTTYRYPTWDSYSMADSSDDPDHLWNCGRSVKFNSYVDVYIYDSGGDSLGNFRFNYSDFSGPNSTKSKTYDRDGSISNGWNEIKYTMNAKLIY